MFGRATIRLGIGPHSSIIFISVACSIHGSSLLVRALDLQLMVASLVPGRGAVK